MRHHHGWKQVLCGGLLMVGASLAYAQEEADRAMGEGGFAWQEWLVPAIVIVVVGIIGGFVAMVLMRQRRPAQLEGIYLEPAVVGSRFEQLLAEIQGLTLRVQGGESKGYYRKIEQLCRVFLERIGHKDARHLSDDEIRKLMSGNEMPQETAAPLKEIFERCKQGAIHETEKLDFSAAELLRDLRTIIKQAERNSPSRA